MSESGEKQIDSGKRSGSDRHSIDNPPLVVGPKSLVVVLKYRKRVPEKEDQLQNDSMVSSSPESDESSIVKIEPPTSVPSLSESTTTRKHKMPKLTERECFETREVLNFLSNPRSNFNFGLIEDMKAFKDDIYELMYFTQRLFDSKHV
ncbi:unnamed protein product [Ambrosiozyma monospora]|uniref:Unnamed protein product n=1 Tax=Ambrosiozyma monospora TaxID=43982 RepID=A0ACB5TF32_AMBMO|nr:unnamed protein product [Ambrosiozyma monospora]